MNTANVVSAAGLVALAGCALTPTLSGRTDAARIEDLQRVKSENVCAFFEGMSLSTCEDGSPVSRFAEDGTIDVLEDEIITVSCEEYNAGVEYRACNWAKHDGGVDSVLQTWKLEDREWLITATKTGEILTSLV